MRQREPTLEEEGGEGRGERGGTECKTLAAEEDEKEKKWEKKVIKILMVEEEQQRCGCWVLLSFSGLQQV